MALGSHHWTLFGYDLRTLPALWVASWREVLWSQDAPLRRWLDEPVSVREPWVDTGLVPESRLLGSQPHSSKSMANAQLLPNEMVLVCWLNIPERAEAHLVSALALEVRARSPFPEDDTRFGWRIAERERGNIRVCLVLVSRSATQNYLQKFLSPEDCANTEAWVRVDELYVVIEGFGEVLRNFRYSQHLKRLGLLCGGILLLVCMLMILPVGLRAIQLAHYEQGLVDARARSVEAVRLRDQLMQRNEQAEEVTRLLKSSGSPYTELLTLTYLLDDTVWLTSLEMRGNKLRIDGMAGNAAELMQSLSAQPHYLDVRAPSATRLDARSGQERFVFDITLAGEGAQR
jgi:general secretion pathway protein L